MKDENFYDYLCRQIESCVIGCDASEVAACENLLVLGTNLLDKMYPVIRDIKALNAGIHITLITQKSVREQLDTTLFEHIIEWTGTYTLQMAEFIKGQIAGTPDGFLFFTAFPVNLRDENIFLIVEELIRTGMNLKVFSNDLSYGSAFYHRYEKIPVYNQGIKLYNKINEFIEIADCN